MHPTVRPAAALLVALALLVPTQMSAHADGRGPTPQLLARAGHGHAVVTALADRLPAVAAANQMSTTRLQQVLESDPTAWIDQDGRLFYVEEAEALTADVASSPPPLASYPESATFLLHSLPGSAHTIFLDFDGADVRGTVWNAGGMPAQFYTGFTLDGDPGRFTSAELAYVQQVWRIVAEKYAAFDVDVTTQDPGPDGYNRSSSLDPTYGDHVVITNDGTAVNTACNNLCSGVAYLGTFSRADGGYFEPAWVFSSKTYGSPVLTAHTIAHEVGHTFGLNHDGVTGGTEYYSGQGNWFPIMGSGTNGVGQWSKGEYAGANNTEDDLAKIAANGAPLRLDDHSDSSIGATALTTGSVAGGVIGTRTDTDVFAVDHDCTTNLTARATGIGGGASLDMSVTVLDALGHVLGSADPVSGQTGSWPALPTGMDAQVTIPAGVGVYYVQIDGVGKGNPATTGYSDYASIGLYQLAISNCDGTMPTPPPGFITDSTGATGATLGAVRAPSAPRIGLASSGRSGRPITATARWSAPASNGGTAITGYRVTAQRLDKAGRVVKVSTSRLISAGAHGLTMKLAKGRYRFLVVAYNQVGASPASTASRIVRAR